MLVFDSKMVAERTAMIPFNLDYTVVTAFRDFQSQSDPACSLAVLSQVPNHIPSMVSLHGSSTGLPLSGSAHFYHVSLHTQWMPLNASLRR